jgi:hypothetical protein
LKTLSAQQGVLEQKVARRELLSLRKGGRDRDLSMYEKLKLKEEIERVQGVNRA